MGRRRARSEATPTLKRKLFLACTHAAALAAGFDFLKVKGAAKRIGDVKTFENFIVPVLQGVDVGRYTTVVVWCETFSMFISSAKYR